MSHMNRIVRIHKFIIVVLILSTILLTWRVSHRPYMVVKAEFEELPPLPNKIELFYKGLKVGNVSKKQFDKEGKNILLYLDIYEKNLNLPSNTFVRIKKSKSEGKPKIHIQFVYPEKSVKKRLANNMTIKGKTMKDLDYYLDKYGDESAIEGVVGNFSGTMNNANATVEEIKKIAELVNAIVGENRENIKISVANTAATTENLKNASKGLSNILNDPSIQSTFGNFNSAAENLNTITARKKILSSIDNIEATTKNIREATNGLKNTVIKADAAIEEADNAFKSVNSVAKSTCTVLNKRFAFLRLMFGKPGCTSENKQGCPICKNGSVVK